MNLISSKKIPVRRLRVKHFSPKKDERRAVYYYHPALYNFTQKNYDHWEMVCSNVISVIFLLYPFAPSAFSAPRVKYTADLHGFDSKSLKALRKDLGKVLEELSLFNEEFLESETFNLEIYELIRNLEKLGKAIDACHNRQDKSQKKRITRSAGSSIRSLHKLIALHLNMPISYYKNCNDRYPAHALYALLRAFRFSDIVIPN